MQAKWGNPEILNTPIGLPTADLYLAWDATRGRFICVLLDNLNNVWFGYSTGSAGSGWQIRQQAVLPYSFSVLWDYPSVAVNAQGRIVVGAYKLPPDAPQDKGFYTLCSLDGGVTFGGNATCNEQQPVPKKVVGLPDESGYGSRIVATASIFQAFVPKLDASTNTPRNIRRFESGDGLTWTDKGFLVSPDFDPPNNTSVFEEACNETGSDCKPVYYAPSLDAAGDPSGRWSVVFQVKYGARNNVMHCASDRGCGWVNLNGNYDEFLASTAISPDGSYWVSYFTFTPAGQSSASNLFSQVIRFPPGLNGQGMTVAEGAAPASWRDHSPACDPCYAAGDYLRMAADSSRFVAVPQMEQSYLAATQRADDLFAMFLQDRTVDQLHPAFYEPYSPPPDTTVQTTYATSWAGATESTTQTGASFFDPPAIGPVKPVRSAGFRPNYVPIRPADILLGLGLPVPPQAYAPTPEERVRRKWSKLP
jgi:hypothetical protein